MKCCSAGVHPIVRMPVVACMQVQRMRVIACVQRLALGWLASASLPPPPNWVGEGPSACCSCCGLSCTHA
jgi:hypothetical protein